MDTKTPARKPSKAAFWIGHVLTVLPTPLLLFSGAMKLTKSQQVIDGFAHLGWPDHLAVPLGIVEITCTLLTLIPRSAALGAILLTGYMGGAIATHVRLGEPFVVQCLLGVVIWLGLYLRDPRVRALIPFRVPA